MRPEDRTGDEGPPPFRREGVGGYDESRLLHDLSALLEELGAAPEVLGLDYDDIWRRIDRDIE